MGYTFLHTKNVEKNSGSKFFSLVRTAIVLLLVVYSLFYSRISFTYETYINSHYTLGVYTILLPLWLVRFYHNRQYNYSNKDVLLLIGLLAISYLFSFTENFSFANEHFLTVSVFVIGISLFLYDSNASELHCVFLGMILLYLIEVILGVYQLLSYNSILKYSLSSLSGSLINSGIYSCYLVSGLGFLYYLLFHFSIKRAWATSNNKTKKIKSHQAAFVIRCLKVGMLVLFVAFCILVILKTSSRTALISLMTSCFALLYLEFGNFFIVYSKRYYYIGIVCIPFIVWAGYELFYIREASAFGRLLRSEIALSHIKDNFWFGTGLGRFSWYYPQWQAQFFHEQLGLSRQYLLSAGESYILFNEFLQLLKEVGSLGVIIYISLLWYVFKSKSKLHKHLFNAVKITLISILSAGLTSYPLHTNVLLFLMIYCIGVLMVLRENRPHIPKLAIPIAGKIFSCFFIMCLGLSIYLGLKSLIQLHAVKEWNSLSTNDDIDRFETEMRYFKLYPALKYNGKFLAEYGRFYLEYSDDHLKSIELLEKAKKFFISRQVITDLGYAYWRAGNHLKAIENFLWLSNYLPNLFTPKYNLLKLYQKIGDIGNAQKVARLILQMPTKIESQEVRQIKYEAGLFYYKH